MSAGAHAGLGQQLAHAACARRRAARPGWSASCRRRPVPIAASSSTTSVNVPPMSTASRQSRAAVRRQAVRRQPSSQVVAGRGEDVEDPALAVLVVADEDAVAVPHVPRREVDLARPRAPPAPRRPGSPIRKSSAPRITMPSCSLSTWWCRNDPVAPPSMRQKHSCRCSPVTTRRRKPGRSVSWNAASSRKYTSCVAGSTSTLRPAASACGPRRRTGAPRPRRPRPPGPRPGWRRRWPGAGGRRWR